MDLDTADQNKPKATHDPGWNDPPTFSYDASKAATKPGKRGSLLNKRVAFPMGKPFPHTPGGSPAPQGDSSPPMPPIAPPCVPSPPGILCQGPPNQKIAKQVMSGHQSCDSQEALDKGVDVLCRLVDSLTSDDTREKEDIKKRLDVLRKMCEEDKLNKDVYGRLVLLASSLESGDTTTAGNIQAGLMVDHVSLCSSWMSGVRLLVRRIAEPNA